MARERLGVALVLPGEPSYGGPAMVLTPATVADHAYGLACAVLGAGPDAVEAAAVGLARGGRSRVAVLGHTRAAALAADVQAAAVSGHGDGPLTSVADVARALAFTRPRLERAVVDLEGRHGLARGAFGRALGTAPAAAVERASVVAAAWGDELDPALMAWLGPGECETLAEVLSSVPPAPEAGVEDLLAVAGATSDHTGSCDVCADRRRALVSVRSLVVQTRLPDAPPRLRGVARSARRRPVVPPPPLEPRRSGRLVRVAVAAAVAVVVAGGTVAVASVVRDRGGHDERVEALTELPPAGQQSLVLSRATFSTSTSSVEVFNRSGRAFTWRAASTVPWVRVSPAGGRIEAGRSVLVHLALDDTAPEGDLQATVTFTASDGATAGLAGAGTVEHPPDLDARRDGCTVSATAEDEGTVSAVVLHWREGGTERTAEMARAEEGWTDGLPRSASSWWVTAVDARGNLARTPESPLPSPAC